METSKGYSRGEHKDMAIPFGKHRGELIADVPTSYLNWLMDQEWTHSQFSSLMKQVRIELDFRRINE